MVNKAPELGKVVTGIPNTYDADGDPTKWGNLLFGYGSILMNILECKSYKSFSDPVATVDPLPATPFTVTNLDPANVDDDNKLFYSWVDSQVVRQ